ncbi:S-layer homology domain-containing protein [Evtepia sp.]|uniref:S-layer homology domain-containing protein n=1 Tax=Evtepia sp. TaxID=2773933 RepID=UPI002A7FEC55|nr:S-layer homology domain-containing protein [Evtepia sp.]MDY4430451.1 S-layer homology domain-containing protein [Evtepia sp.]
MSEIGAQYRYSDYTCVQVTRSQDGKDVYLYYTFNNAHTFVADFGLPLRITTSDLGISGAWTSASVSGAKYGTATASAGNGVTYTPTEIMQGVETLQLTLTDSTGSVTHTIYIYPATTVYYEEGFATLTGFNGGSTGTGTQATQVAGRSGDEYGKDTKYVSESAGASNDTQAISRAKGDKAEFTFTGTGVDIYANSTTATGSLMIKIADSSKATVKLLQVNTALLNGSSDATNNQEVTGYNVPVASITGLANGTYTVTITHVDDKTVNLDGFRVYGTLATEPDFYKTDLEDNPTFIELRDQVLAGLSVTATGSNQTNAALPEEATTVALVASSDKYTQDNVNDLLTNGPKNEIYLQPNQALVVKITTDREVQIGLKALNAATTYTINNGDSKNISTSTDMFYTVLNKGTSGAQTITITNTGTGILSVTKLKVCDDPNAALGTLTEEDLTDALVSLGLQDPPVEDNGSSGTDTPTTPPTTDPGTGTPTTPADPATGLPFTDVGPGDWFLENVKYAYEKGLMNGTGDTTFSPKMTTYRAMIVTILHRLEGTPAPDAQAPFTDVPAGQYYAEAVAWAAANSIVNGTSETTYAPLNNITREQMAAILYRYAQYKGYDVSGSADLSAFTDATSISDYAVSALQWAVDAGLINGKGNGILDPKGSATRAEVSAILSRFCENIAG